MGVASAAGAQGAGPEAFATSTIIEDLPRGTLTAGTASAPFASCPSGNSTNEEAATPSISGSADADTSLDPTPEEAALHYARHIGAARAAAEAAEARRKGPQPLTAAEARATAAAKGLELVPASKGAAGFKCVNKDRGKYKAQVSENGKKPLTAVEARAAAAAEGLELVPSGNAAGFKGVAEK